jgi:Spy/CpxP family protein refolding chaperone
MALAAGAQPRRGARAQRPAITAAANYLGLSDQQVQELTALRRDEQNALAPLRGQIGEKSKALAEARKAANPDPAVVGQLVLDLQRLRDEIRRANEDYHTKAVAVLDAGQREKLASLEKAGERDATTRAAVAGATALNLILPPQTQRPAQRARP